MSAPPSNPQPGTYEWCAAQFHNCVKRPGGVWHCHHPECTYAPCNCPPAEPPPPPLRVRMRFRTQDHPQANGRKARDGEHAWPFRFLLEDGRTLVVEMGDEGRMHVAECVTQSAVDDIKEATELNRQLVEARHDARVLAYALSEGGRCRARHVEPVTPCQACDDLAAARTRHSPAYASPEEPPA